MSTTAICPSCQTLTGLRLVNEIGGVVTLGCRDCGTEFKPGVITNPTTYLSTSDGLWRVIHQDSPGCANKASRAEAEAYATWAGITPTHLWNGDTGTLQPI